MFITPFQLPFKKPTPSLRIMDYTQATYEHVRARERKLAALKGKRRERKKAAWEQHGCPDCAIRRSCIGATLHQWDEESLSRQSVGKDLDTLPPEDHVCQHTVSTILEPPQAMHFRTEHLPNDVQLIPGSDRGEVLVPTAASRDAMSEPHPEDRFKLPVGETCTRRSCVTVTPQHKSTKSKRLIVRLKVASTELLAAAAKPHQRCKSRKHKHSVMPRSSHTASRSAVQPAVIMRELPSSRCSGRKRFRPNHPFADGY